MNLPLLALGLVLRAHSFTALTDEIASPPTSDDFTKAILSVTYTKAPFIANIAASSIPADSLAFPQFLL